MRNFITHKNKNLTCGITAPPKILSISPSIVAPNATVSSNAIVTHSQNHGITQLNDTTCIEMPG